MSDYKFQIQELAEQAALDRCGAQFDELSQRRRDELYEAAMDEWHDRRAARAEMLRDMARDEEAGI